MPNNASEPSGTPIIRRDGVALDSQPEPDTTFPSTEQDMLPREGEEQALESHEVFELQAFSERKNWIEEKVKVNDIYFSVYWCLSLCSFWKRCLL
jgi:hypothetical protein